MRINRRIGDVQGFKRHYNDFIQQRMQDAKAHEERATWLSLAGLLLRGDALSGKNDGLAVEIRRLDADHGVFLVTCDDDKLGAFFLELWRDYDRLRRDKDWLPTEPPSKAEGYTEDDVFDWYHRGGKQSIGSLRALAKHLGIAYGTTRTHHANYLKQYPNGQLPDSITHFAGMALLPPENE